MPKPDKATLRAWLITHHAPSKLALDYASVTSEDLVIAVDGGFERCLELGLKPSILIGDLDSLRRPLLDQVPTDCQKISYPSHKNETDTQLALEYCLKQGISEIIICNDLSGRFDHCLALVQNLLQAHQSGVKASLASANQLVFILNQHNELFYPAGTQISLIALSPEAHFKSSTGLAFPLNNLFLYNWQSRGISNRTTSSEQRIDLASGLVLAVITLAP